jgi:predicted DNA-binding mobile mystery protein A
MAKSEFIRQSVQARMSLDARRLAMQGAAQTLARPRGGWIQAIRTGLGMSSADLARRLKVTPSTIHRLEASENAGTINLESLKKVANELGCDVVYALVPRQDLEHVVHERALKLATQTLGRTQLTMSLEQQTVQPDVLNKMIERKARELAESTTLWKVQKSDVE